jgi:hypothetical protein
LKKGSASSLSKARPVVRGEEQVFRMTELYNFDFSERGIHNAVFGITEKHKTSGKPGACFDFPSAMVILRMHHIRCLPGILPTMVFCMQKNQLTVIWNGSLYARHHLWALPGPIGTNTIIATDLADDDFPGAIIVGLGEPGKLTSYLLSKTVEQGVSKHLLDMNSKPGNKKRNRYIGINYWPADMAAFQLNIH